MVDSTILQQQKSAVGQPLAHACQVCPITVGGAPLQGSCQNIAVCVEATLQPDRVRNRLLSKMQPAHKDYAMKASM